jgi:hypothetical protein
MRLKSFGCSFIFGSELSDDNSDSNNLRPSRLTWPAHLAQHLGYDYETHARPGAGNLQIAERVLSHAVDDSDDFFAIGWTWTDRFDVWDPAGDSRHFRDDNLWFKWSTIVPSDNSDRAKNYYRDLHSEYRDKLTTLMTVRLVIDTLKQKGIPYVMTYMDELMFDQQWHTTPAVTDLQAYIQPCMTTFDGQNLLDWSRQQGYPVSDRWHPLDAAHRAAGDHVINVVDKNRATPAKY